MRAALLCLALTFASSSALAQPLPIDHLTPAFPEGNARKAAVIVSWATVITSLALETWDAARDTNPKRALLLEGVRLGAVQGATWGLKKAIGRTRPCAPGGCGVDEDNASFPSGHVAFSCSAISLKSGQKELGLKWSLGIGTAGGRIGGAKHWLTDTLAGCGLGLLGGTFIR